MGWSCGDEYETITLKDAAAYGLSEDLPEKEIRAALREQMRRHKLCMDGDPTAAEIQEHYDELPDSEKGKDWKPMGSMLKLIKKYEGLRIYRIYPEEAEE